MHLRACFQISCEIGQAPALSSAICRRRPSLQGWYSDPVHCMA
uniref:Uncharacterized protein n=1 Tax=Arundo donax TaxID=35708 RepID=A0A0A8YJG4_ARUDO